MSLDIAILGADGSPKDQVTIGMDEHHRLMQLIGGRDGLLARLNDYYADAEYEHSELDGLIAEATSLAARCRDDERLYSILSELSKLSQNAKSVGEALVVIAD